MNEIINKLQKEGWGITINIHQFAYSCHLNWQGGTQEKPVNRFYVGSGKDVNDALMNTYQKINPAELKK